MAEKITYYAVARRRRDWRQIHPGWPAAAITRRWPCVDESFTREC